MQKPTEKPLKAVSFSTHNKPHLSEELSHSWLLHCLRELPCVAAGSGESQSGQSTTRQGLQQKRYSVPSQWVAGEQGLCQSSEC